MGRGLSGDRSAGNPKGAYAEIIYKKQKGGKQNRSNFTAAKKRELYHIITRSRADTRSQALSRLSPAQAFERVKSCGGVLPSNERRFLQVSPPSRV